MTLRFARHTNNLEHIKSFYVDILGFNLIGGFENHNDYDGIFIGKTTENWHLEFTKTNEIVAFNFGDDDFLVFYPNSKKEYKSISDKLVLNNIKFIKAKNPYWKDNGIMVLDPDGFRIIISNLKTI